MSNEYGKIHTDGSRSGGQPVLKPCPFCDGQAAIVEFQAAGGPWYMGECQEPSCDAAGPAFTTEAEAIAAYNTRQPTQSDEWQAGYEAGVEAAAKALEDDAKRCDCFARNEGECGCGAWCEWKSITSQRAIEIVRALKELSK